MVEITNLKKSFGNHVVLQGVSLSVARGEVVCLIGPSGSGKSTVLRCINGLESYDAGEVSVFGKRVDRTSDEIHKLRGSLGMVFQRFNLFGHRTVLQNVIEGPVSVKREPIAQARLQAMSLLEKVGLSEKANAYPAQLSGGQIGRAHV